MVKYISAFNYCRRYRLSYRMCIITQRVCDCTVPYHHYQYYFFPVAVDTLGPSSDKAHSLIAEIGSRATPLYQGISVTIQRVKCSALCQHVHTAIVPIVIIYQSDCVKQNWKNLGF